MAAPRPALTRLALTRLALTRPALARLALTRLPLLVLAGMLGLVATPAVGAEHLVEEAADTGSVGVWPLDPVPEVVQDFAPPDVPWASGHRGVDLAGAIGRPVRAALGGTVSFVGRIAGVGVVVVDHGDTRTTYQPVTASVSRGNEVTAGEAVGRLAWYGSHCAPRACLHWGRLRGSDYLDPLVLVGGGPGPVRLLPLAALPGPGAGLLRVGELASVQARGWAWR